MSPAHRFANAAIVAMLALQVAWHGWLAPAQTVAPWSIVLAFSLPLAPALWLLLRRQPRAPFWGALAALLYFCHGVMDAYAAPEVRGLAVLEAALSAALIVAASWDGMRARFRRKPAAPPPPAV